MSSLTVKDLCKTYIINKRQNHVLKNISFEMQEGEMVAVMGPSGSGKSTLLYAVSGMDSLTAGQIDFFGKDLSSLSPTQISEVRLEEMGFIFQQMYMLKNLSIYDNIKLLREARLVDEYVEEMLLKALKNAELYEERIDAKENCFYDDIEIERLADENFEKIYELIIWLVLTYGQENYQFLKENLSDEYKEVFDKYSNEKNDVENLINSINNFEDEDIKIRASALVE